MSVATTKQPCIRWRRCRAGIDMFSVYQGLTRAVASDFTSAVVIRVANSGCDGDDLLLGFYVVEWNRFDGDEDR